MTFQRTATIFVFKVRQSPGNARQERPDLAAKNLQRHFSRIKPRSFGRNPTFFRGAFPFQKCSDLLRTVLNFRNCEAIAGIQRLESEPIREETSSACLAWRSSPSSVRALLVRKMLLPVPLRDSLGINPSAAETAIYWRLTARLKWCPSRFYAHSSLRSCAFFRLSTREAGRRRN
jgi:hypothetical protein